LKSCGEPALQEFSSHRGVFLSGVEIAATVFANILKDTPRRPVGSHLFIAAHSPVRCPGSCAVSAFTHRDCSTGHCRALHPVCGEIFGFGRFQQMVRNSGALPAQALLQETKAQLAALVKGAPGEMASASSWWRWKRMPAKNKKNIRRPRRGSRKSCKHNTQLELRYR
jgi:hypothetical protein